MWYKELKDESFKKHGEIISIQNDMTFLSDYIQSTVCADDMRNAILRRYNHSVFLEPAHGIGVVAFEDEYGETDVFLLSYPIKINADVWFSVLSYDNAFSYYLFAKNKGDVKNAKKNLDFSYKPSVYVEQLNTFSFQEKSSKYVFKGESHPFCEMIYLDSGCLKYKLDNNEMLLRQGDMLFCDVNQHHSMRTESDKMVSFANMSFCLCIPEIYRNFFGQIIKANQQQKSMIEMMVNEYKLSDNVSYDFIINNINNLILSVIRQKTADVSSQVTKTPHVIKTNNTMVNKAIDIINQNITNGDLTVSWIAKALNVSTSYLHRTFKEVLNNNVVNIIKEKKMSYAKFLLSEGELSITEISGLLGFCSQSYFSTQFRETYDMTPREYSNQVCHKLDGGC